MHGIIHLPQGIVDTLGAIAAYGTNIADRGTRAATIDETVTEVKKLGSAEEWKRAGEYAISPEGIADGTLAVITARAGVPEAGPKPSAPITAARTISKAEKRVLAEQAAARTLARAGYEELPARLSRNNGFDGVWVKRGPNGEIVDIIVSESKYGAEGTASLSKTKTTGKQLSDEWIDANIEKMLESTDAEVRRTGELLQQKRSMIRTKGNVLDAEGTNRWNILE